jgi:hypothetical protein
VGVRASESIEYLQYRAEGTCFVRIADAVIDASPCPTEKKGEFRLETNRPRSGGSTSSSTERQQGGCS